jgi:hypothetical protein
MSQQPEHRANLSAAKRPREFSSDLRQKLSYGQTHRQIKIVYKTGQIVIVNSGVEAAKLLGLSSATISRIVYGEVRPPEHIESMTKVKD